MAAIIDFGIKTGYIAYQFRQSTISTSPILPRNFFRFFFHLPMLHYSEFPPFFELPFFCDVGESAQYFGFWAWSIVQAVKLWRGLILRKSENARHCLNIDIEMKAINTTQKLVVLVGAITKKRSMKKVTLFLRCFHLTHFPLCNSQLFFLGQKTKSNENTENQWIWKVFLGIKRESCCTSEYAGGRVARWVAGVGCADGGSLSYSPLHGSPGVLFSPAHNLATIMWHNCFIVMIVWWELEWESGWFGTFFRQIL